MKRKTKCNMLIAICLVLMVFAVCFLVYHSLIFEDRLSIEEIEKIREENNYKVFINTSEQASTDKGTSFRKKVINTDTYVYCEVIKESYKQEYIISNGNDEFDKSFYGDLKNIPMLDVYTVRVIEDTESLFEKNSILTYSYGLLTQNNRPKPNVGDKVILPFNIMNDDVTDCVSGINGFYYINNGYGIAAFEEEKEFTYTGKSAVDILKALKKTDAEKKEYLNLIKMRYERSGGKDGYESIEMLREQIKEKLEAKKNAEK